MKRKYVPIRKTASVFLLVSAGCIGSAFAQEEADRAMTGSDSASGYSSWNVQFLHGTEFQEPFNSRDVHKDIMTIENSSARSWGSSDFCIDTMYSTENDLNTDGFEVYAWEGYAEWFPSASISKMTGADLSVGILNDVSLTMGINAGRKSTGSDPLVYLPGLTFDLKLPGFAFFSLGTYAYIDQGQVNNGDSNNCHSPGAQVTPSWLLPFSVGGADFQFGGFIDFITAHGNCASQVVSQPQLTMDVGKMLGATPGKFYAGVEYQYWNNKFGFEGMDEHFPQVMAAYKF